MARARSDRSAIRSLIKQHAAIRLDLGCGPNKHDGFVGMDSRALPGVDIVHDLEETPWPIPDDCASAVIMSHVWEHITPKRTLAVMAEIHRICRKGANVFIAAPYGVGTRFQQDPTHINSSNEATWYYWDDTHPLWQVYQPPVFRVISYERIPVGGDSDFNAVLQVVK